MQASRKHLFTGLLDITGCQREKLAPCLGITGLRPAEMKKKTDPFYDRRVLMDDDPEDPLPFLGPQKVL